MFKVERNINGGTTTKRADECAPTPGPLRAVMGTDGRHGGVPILTDHPSFSDDVNWPYHPLVCKVFFGHCHAPRAVAEETAKKIVLSYNSHDALVEVAEMVVQWSNGLRHETAHESKMVKAAKAALALARGEV